MYRKIMVPLDGSEMAECVIPHVETLAKGSTETEVILFRVCEPPVILADFPASRQTEWSDHVRERTAHIQQQCSLYLDEAEKRLQQAGIKTATKTGLGNAAEQIIDYAVQNQVELIVMATHGRSGIMRWAYGSVADKVLRASPVPVMIIRPDECRPER